MFFRILKDSKYSIFEAYQERIVSHFTLIKEIISFQFQIKWDEHLRILTTRASQGKQGGGRRVPVGFIRLPIEFPMIRGKEYQETFSRTGSQSLIQGQAWRMGQPLPHLTCPCGSAELPLRVEAPYDARVQLQTDQSPFKIISSPKCT